MQLKKIALVFLVVIMMFSLAAIGIAAEEAGSEFSISAKLESENAISADPFAVKPGDIIELIVSVDSNPGALRSLEIRAEFDNEALEFQGIATDDYGVIFEKNDTATRTKVTSKDDANSEGLVQVMLMANTGYESDKTGEFITLRFKVAETFDGDIEKLELTYAKYISAKGFGDADLPALPAVKAHNYGEPEVIPADCTSAEKKIYTCTADGCDEVLEVSDGVIGGHKCENLVPAAAPDCVTDGNVAYYVCGNAGCGKYIAEDKTTILESIVDPKIGHKCETLVPAVAPDCVKDGNIAHYVCGNAGCGKYIAEDKTTILASIVDPKIGHKCENLVPAVAPDCVTDGNVAYYVCGNTACGKYVAEDKTTILDSIVDPKIGHKCETLVPAVAPDCENDGNVAYYVCGNEGCGKYIAEDKTTILETIVDPKLGHNYGDLIAKVEPTTKSEGNVAYYQCSRCSKYFDANKKEIDSPVIEKLPKMISTPENPVWTKGDETSLKFVSDAEYDKFLGVKLNGSVLEQGAYKLESDDDGNTVVILEPAYLEILDKGEYTIAIESENGVCDASFTVENNGAIVTVIIVIVAVLVIVAGAAAAVIVLKKKNII